MASSKALLPIASRATSLSAAAARAQTRSLQTSATAALDRRQQQSHSNTPGNRAPYGKKNSNFNRPRRDRDAGARGWGKPRPVSLAFTERQLVRFRETQDDRDLDAQARKNAVAAQYESASRQLDLKTGSYLESPALEALNVDQGVLSTFQPGDFVEIRRSFQTFLAVILPLPENIRADRRLWICALSSTGSVEVYREADVMFRLPGLVSSPLAEKAGAVEGEISLGGESESDSPGGEPWETSRIDRDILEARSFVLSRLRSMKLRRDDESRRLLPAFQREFLVEHRDPKSFDRKGKRVATTDVADLKSVTTTEAAQRLDELSPSPSSSPVEHNTYSSSGPSSGKRRDFKGKQMPSSSTSPITLFATHTLLMAHPEHFMADVLHHRSSHLFTRRANSERQSWIQVQQWLAAEQQSLMTTSNVPKPQIPASSDSSESPIEAFCHRARLIKTRREQMLADLQPQIPTVVGSPQAIPMPHMDTAGTSASEYFEWTKEDQIILRFLKSALGSRRTIQTDLFISTAMTIIKRAGGVPKLPPLEYSGNIDTVKYTQDQFRKLSADRADAAMKMARSLGLDTPNNLRPGPDLSSALVTKFLTDIGVVPPWFNLQANDVTLRSVTNAGLPSSTSESSDGSSTSSQKYTTLTPDAEAVQPRDFDELPVFVIDDAGAHELDDGISIQATSQPNDWWVHIHVADPTAILNPEDPLSMQAYRQYSTIYFPERQYPLLPDQALMDQVDMGSFRRRTASSDQLQRALTFSAKINDQTGTVSEYKVAPSLLRNLKVCTYQQVQNLFDGSNDEPGLFSEDDQSRLRTLRKISTVLGERRFQDGAFSTTALRPDVKVSPKPLPGQFEDLTRPHVFAGFPQIDLQLLKPSGQAPGSSSDTMVGELMVLAGRVLGAWAQEHGVPVPYRGQRFTEEQTAAQSQKMLQDTVNKHRDPVTGLVDAGAIMRLMSVLPKTVLSVEPLGHMAMAIHLRSSPSSNGDVLGRSGYVQCTSPLRRYGDLMVHWQIRAALAAMARGKSPTANLPWQRESMQAELGRLLQQGSWHRDISRASTMFWTCLHISRLLKLKAEGREDEIREQDRKFLEPAPATCTFEVLRLLKGADGDTIVLAHGLGVQADCEWSPFETRPQLGQSIMVKPIYVKFAGLRSRIVVRRV
ncbi:hypothetical protein CF319_g1536 [Tilletia indica]|uniref:RNB domain-containing protein n=1 Tax=Tilletia indica TaxID=43049 RepID=A0A177TSK4_9BASI|nr:hypothetical protein CF319_g1536 [Tilletia indica]KAE8259904.1 hypothetical protein A4X13_0g710 [Tilletia indica]